jgi:hypothetical protein
MADLETNFFLEESKVAALASLGIICYPDAKAVVRYQR